MAITAQRLLSDGRAEITQVSGGDRERTWIIRVNSVEDTEDGIYESGALPLIGSSLVGHPQMTLRSYSVAREGKFLFRVVGQYSSRTESKKERDERNKEIFPPWLRPPAITCPVTEFTDEPLKDKDGRTIRNSFGTPFTATQPRRRWAPIIRVRAPVPSIPSWYYTLAGKRNSSPVVVTRATGALPTFPTGTLLFVPGEIGEYVREPSPGGGNYVYDMLNFELHYNEDEWKWEPVDMGPQYLNDDDEPTYFQDGMGFLDGLGSEAADPDNPTILDFQYYELANFAALPLTEF
jgi:hypothetical protein